MTGEDISKLRKMVIELLGSVELLVYIKDNDPFSVQVLQFAEMLSEVSQGKILITREKVENQPPHLPSFTVACGDRRNLHYVAVPTGYELNPFMEALQFAVQGYAPVSARTRETLEKISRPAEVVVLISPTCAQCPAVVGMALRLAATNPVVSVTIADVCRARDLADEFGVRSVPATIINREIVLIGLVTEEQVVALIAGQGTLAYEKESMRSMIELGLIPKAAAVIRNRRGGEAILSLFQEGDFSMRMGALLVLEEVLDQDADSMRRMVPQLIEMLSHEDYRIRGDSADLLGKIGDRRAIAHLDRLRNDRHPEVVEAAVEGILMIRKGGKGRP